jgi:hypothetical protein
MIAFAGFVLFRILLINQNKNRQALISPWTEHQIEEERKYGSGPLPRRKYTLVFELFRTVGGEPAIRWIARWLRREEERKGDEKMTFRYGL